jgi:methionyl-tRNA formyltransferase
VVTDQHTDPSPVEKMAKEHNLKVAYYPDFDHNLITGDTLGLCASFDHLIPQEIIEKFGGNLYNLHPSLLPQYRNVSPVQYAIALGDTETGITLFRIAPTIDDGAIITQITEPIQPDDTTPTLTSRLFSLGAQLFLSFLDNPTRIPTHHSEARQSEGWIFTKRLTRASGYVEWSVLSKLLANQPITPAETTNQLLKLRLSKIESFGLIIDNWLLVINDLLRSLSPWPTLWSLVPSKKGELRITVESVLPEITLKIASKPNPISYVDFTKYYL